MNDPGPPPGGLIKSSYMDRFYKWVKSMQPVRSPDTLLRRSTAGTSRIPISEDGSADDETPFPFKGEWNPDSAYSKNDIVYTIGAQQYRLEGTWIALKDVPAGELSPRPLESGGDENWGVFALGSTNSALYYRSTFGGTIAASPDGTAIGEIGSESAVWGGPFLIVRAAGAGGSGSIHLDCGYSNKKFYPQLVGYTNESGAPTFRWFICADEGL